MSETPSGPLRKAIPKVSKSSLETPLNLKWPDVSHVGVDAVKNDLHRYLEGCNVGRKPVRNATKTEAVATEAQATRDSADVAAIRQALAVGVNECTRCLEQDRLDVLLVCRSCPLPALSRHLLPLAATRSCSAGAVPGLSDHVAPLIGVQRAIALGIKRGRGDQGMLDDLVSSVSSNLPKIIVPWLRQVEVHTTDGNDSCSSSQVLSTDAARVGSQHKVGDEQTDAAPPAKRVKQATSKRRTVASLKSSDPPRIDYLNLAIKTHCSDQERQLMKAQRKQTRRQKQSQAQAEKVASATPSPKNAEMPEKS